VFVARASRLLLLALLIGGQARHYWHATQLAEKGTKQKK
jgi:hypothetical protein